jgi:ABC-2 type transport system permease protein
MTAISSAGTVTRRDLRPRFTTLLSDVAIVAGRELRPLLRSPFSLIFGMIQPLVFLALFGPLLAGSVGDRPGGLGPDVWQWFVPAILVMTTLFGTSTVGANLLSEFLTGSHERMLVTPLSRQSLLVGRALKEMVPLAGQALVIILVMLPFGFKLFPAGAVLGLVLLTLFGIGLGSLSYSLAVAVRRTDWMFWVVHQTLLFPLMILSGMLLPLETGPGWMRAAAQFNPLAHMVTAERLLFAGRIGEPEVLWGFVAATLTAAIGLVVGIRAMRRSA